MSTKTVLLETFAGHFVHYLCLLLVCDSGWVADTKMTSDFCVVFSSVQRPEDGGKRHRLKGTAHNGLCCRTYAPKVSGIITLDYHPTPSVSIFPLWLFPCVRDYDRTGVRYGGSPWAISGIAVISNAAMCLEQYPLRVYSVTISLNVRKQPIRLGWAEQMFLCRVSPFTIWEKLYNGTYVCCGLNTRLYTLQFVGSDSVTENVRTAFNIESHLFQPKSLCWINFWGRWE